MIRTSFSCLALLALVMAGRLPLPPAAAQAPAPSDAFAATAARLETAALAGNVEAVKTERLNVLRMLAASPSADRAGLMRYTVAYAAWRLAFATGLAASEQSNLLEDAAVQISNVLAATPNDAEAVGLQACIFGAQIAKNPDLGMSLGPQAGQAIDRALRLAPANPRLFVISGQSLFNAPPEYGGSISQAEARFRASLNAFEKEPPQKPWPNWGRFDAHAWLGQALASRGDKAGARAEYGKALLIAPDSGWVRNVLLPQVR